MSTYIGIIAGVAVFWIGFKAGCYYIESKWRRSLLDSATEAAESALEVEAEARKTHEAIESVGPSTSAAHGSSMLSGESDWEAEETATADPPEGDS